MRHRCDPLFPVFEVVYLWRQMPSLGRKRNSRNKDLFPHEVFPLSAALASLFDFMVASGVVILILIWAKVRCRHRASLAAADSTPACYFDGRPGSGCSWPAPICSSKPRTTS